MKTETRRAALGQAKLALCFHIPSQASLHGTVKTHRPFCSANGPASPRNLFENTGLRLVSKRGDVVKRRPQARLRVSFPQQIQHSCSESTPCFLSSYPCSSEPSVVKKVSYSREPLLFALRARRGNGKNHWVALGLQAGRCCEKASASSLESVFCKKAPAFA
jgi:hypothetical protein